MNDSDVQMLRTLLADARAASARDLELRREAVARLTEALDALRNLRSGLWEIGYVHEIVDRILNKGVP